MKLIQAYSLKIVCFTLPILVGCSSLSPFGQAAGEPEGSVLAIVNAYPVIAVSTTTAFPISPTCVLTAGHNLNPRLPIASVGGTPMTSILAPDDWPDTSVPQNDMVSLHTSEQRFGYNTLAFERPMRRDELVGVIGFIADHTDVDPVGFIGEIPDVVWGRIIEPPRLNAKGRALMKIAVPAGDYRGMSGGPVVAFDEDKKPLIVGLAIKQGIVWDGVDGRFRFSITAVRPSRRDITRYTQVRLLPALE